ncbi:hypothetical protein B7494_g1445 [Chlorociboria aeruginascens]|nr:hypothetical protein B7494_g1445 [Chlorociboria aeruginascens]
MKLSIIAAILVSVAATAKIDFAHLGRLIPPVEAGDEFPLASVNSTGSAFFTQLLDHDDPSKGTFQQKFWWNSEFWAGPGSPVVIFTPGEVAAANYGSYLTNATITGLFAQEIEGAVVLVEHRYWGDSSPYDYLDSETLQLLTLDQAIADFVYFSKTVDLPFDTNHSSNSGNAPWVFSGGSYSGALTAWTESTSPGTFWAYHSSSAPVEAIYDYWQYFVPVQEGMPKNCSKDLSLVIDHIDNILIHGTAAEKTALKTQFGLAALEHDDDFGAFLENAPWLWQSNSFYSEYSGFYQFCDAGVHAGAAVTLDRSGVGLEIALAGYANFTQSNLIPGYCQTYGYTDELELACMDTYNTSNKIFTDRTVGNGIDLQWVWMTCNEPFNYWQDGAPRGTPSIVSRLVTGDYWQRQCGLFFPTVNGYTYGSNISQNINAHQVNKHTEGWRLENTTRLIWTNGYVIIDEP